MTPQASPEEGSLSKNLVEKFFRFFEDTKVSSSTLDTIFLADFIERTLELRQLEHFKLEKRCFSFTSKGSKFSLNLADGVFSEPEHAFPDVEILFESPLYKKIHSHLSQKNSCL